MMTREAILWRCQKIVVDHLGLVTTPPDKADFIDELGADSLDLVELLMAFEDDFGLNIPDDEAERIESISAAVDYVWTHQS